MDSYEIIKEKLGLRPIQGALLKGYIMKVHTYVIDVMWLMFAVLGSWASAAILSVLAHHLIVQETLQKRPPFANQIRPPPLFALGEIIIV